MVTHGNAIRNLRGKPHIRTYGSANSNANWYTYNDSNCYTYSNANANYSSHPRANIYADRIGRDFANQASTSQCC